MYVVITEQLERAVRFIPAVNNTATGHGRHSLDILFSLTDPHAERAVDFVLFTGWYRSDDPINSREPLPATVNFHSLSPQYTGHSDSGLCNLLGAGASNCFLSTTYCAGDALFNTLRDDGEEAFWQAMENLLVSHNWNDQPPTE